MSPGTTTRVVPGAMFISLWGLLMFLGVTTTLYPVRRAFGARHETVKTDGPTSETTMLVGAGITGTEGPMSKQNYRTLNDFCRHVKTSKTVGKS